MFQVKLFRENVKCLSADAAERNQTDCHCRKKPDIINLATKEPQLKVYICFYILTMNILIE